MKLREIFRFEFVHQARRFSTWLFFAVLAFFAFVFTGETFVAGARNGDYFLNALILLAVPAGILLAVLSSGLDAEYLGPFRPAAYLSAYAFILLTNAFVATAIQFSFALLSRRAIASYLGGLLLFVVAWISDSLVREWLGLWELARLLDPSGLAVVSDLSTAWTPVEKNTLLVGLESSLLANRLLWVAVALGVLAFTHHRSARPAEVRLRNPRAPDARHRVEFVPERRKELGRTHSSGCGGASESVCARDVAHGRFDVPQNRACHHPHVARRLQ